MTGPNSQDETRRPPTGFKPAAAVDSDSDPIPVIGDPRVVSMVRMTAANDNPPPPMGRVQWLLIVVFLLAGAAGAYFLVR